MSIIKNNYLVSIITPLYNCELYLNDCIDSVISQTYKNWEMLIVDDHSNDSSYKLAKSYSQMDKRIKVFKLSENSGSGVARNKAIKEANGRFIAFLDSDDVWHHDKLKIHVEIMLSNNSPFSHTSYGFMKESGEILEKSYRVSSNLVTYKKLLMKTEISCLTAMYDVDKIGKFYLPSLRRKQDYALWLSILKQGHNSLPVDLVLAWYRQRNGSATSKKHKLIFNHYRFLRTHESLDPFKALYYTLCWIMNGLKKYYF